MDLDDDYKFAMDCEVNQKYRRTDSIRSSLIQLYALRSKVPYDVYTERQRDLLQEYSLEVDKESGTNTFVNSAMKFAKETTRSCNADKWQSIYKKRLDEGMTAADIITSLNSNFEPIIELSKKYKNLYKNQVLKLDTELENSPNQTTSVCNEPQNSNKIMKFIENKLKNDDNSLPNQGKNSPTRVSGIFRKKGSQRSLFVSNSQPSSQSQSSVEFVDESNYHSQNELKLSAEDNSKETRKSSFITGLEKHLTDQVLDNKMDSNQAREIIDDVRKNVVPFKDPTKKLKKSLDNDIPNNENLLVNDERLKGIEKPMIELIQGEIMSNLGDTDWSNIAGLEYAKSKIKQIAILPLKRPDLFTGIRSPPKGILLFGPPGTGKTMIGRCIASQANATFFSITSSTLTSKWIGDGEKAMKTLFAVARCLKPSVIFIDEVDSLLKTRSDTEHESSRRMKTEFLSQFDGLSNQTNDGLLVIGTTNRPQELDEAVRRRFAAKLFISLPEKSARKLIISNNLKGEKNILTDDEIDLIADKTEGYSGSDMKHLCSEAAMYSFKDIFEKLAEINKDDIREINYNDFILALSTVKPSFSCEDLKDYELWNKKYGSDV